MQVYVPIWQDEQHEKWKLGSKVKVYVNNEQITRIADPLNNTFGGRNENTEVDLNSLEHDRLLSAY